MAQAVSFAADIRPLFTPTDIDHMSWFCDLTDYAAVKTNAQVILGRLTGKGGKVMPPPPAKGGDGPWSAAKIATFQAWIDQGFPP
jgi:hypothetical protein